MHRPARLRILHPRKMKRLRCRRQRHTGAHRRRQKCLHTGQAHQGRPWFRPRQSDHIRPTTGCSRQQPPSGSAPWLPVAPFEPKFVALKRHSSSFMGGRRAEQPNERHWHPRMRNTENGREPSELTQLVVLWDSPAGSSFANGCSRATIPLRSVSSRRDGTDWDRRVRAICYHNYHSQQILATPLRMRATGMARAQLLHQPVRIRCVMMTTAL
mmetsp:Transcript_23755/g.67148  ORF Transcript_23755/g.67148 Transcript_23755/m.67148 type:complete len:213 (-) Transcript_23755:792-1430(-)